MSGPSEPWSTMTHDEYVVEYPIRHKHSELLRELIPDLGKARSAQTIAHRTFWRGVELIHQRFPYGPHYHNDVGLSSGKYIERNYVRHVSGSMFTLGTYFCTWRIWGERDTGLADDLAAWLGFPAHQQLGMP